MTNTPMKKSAFRLYTLEELGSVIDQASEACPIKWDGFFVEHCSEPVELRGEALHRVLWQGRQWAVTEYGLECRDGLYAISKEDILDKSDTHGLHRHVGPKNWVDAPEFMTALAVARVIHGDGGANFLEGACEGISENWVNRNMDRFEPEAA